MEKSESIKELAAALNAAQSTLQVAKKGSENPFFKSKYADLFSVWDAARPALTENGLSVSQIAETDPEGRAYLETILMHTSGEWIKGRLPLMALKADPQAQGSAITYARRYSLSAIVGLCTEEDDDGEGAMDRKGKPASKKAAAEPPAEGGMCPIHNVPFKLFTKGDQKWYSHKTEDGWCNKDKLESKVKIDMGWLKESLETLNWADVSKYLRERFGASGTSVKQLVESLSPEQQEEFAAEVSFRLES